MRHRTQAEREDIVRRLENSGLSVAAFARREGLSMYSVRRWQRGLRDAEPTFAEVVVEAPRGPGRAGAERVVVETPNGFVVAWEGVSDVSSFALLVRELAL
jgi:transposase-like protein